MHALHDAPEDGGHDVHAALPVAALYVPTLHDIQLIFGPVKPALQVQVLRAEYPDSGELEFAGQLVHAVAPTTVEYDPAAHGVHDPASG